MPRKRVYSGHKGGRDNTSRVGDKPIKRPPPTPQRFEGDSEKVSASAKKLRMSTDDYHVNMDPTFGYRLIEFVSVFTAIAQLVVCKCGSDVKFQESSIRGLGSRIVVVCATCEAQYVTSCPLIGHAYDVNRRMVLAMRILGIGRNGIEKFCAFMCLPHPVFKSFYDQVVKTISIAATAVRDLSMKNAAAKEKELLEEDGESRGLTVSGDGTWRKRGFSSMLGVTTLIGWCTGKIVDLEVKSKICKACDSWKSKEGTAEYEEWKSSHDDQCQQNHEGSSGKMEVDSVIDMFKRYNVKYCQYIGDGDSKIFKGVLESDPYNDFTVAKKECIDHVQKRMGRHLRALVKSEKRLGGKGKLTGKLIDELTIYYGLAIRRNSSSVESMQREIWATLYHKVSTDDKPQHERCPKGEDSWCSWQQANATGELHTYRHKPAMQQKVFSALLPVYKELSRDELLERCLGGFTQNSNESFNATLWQMAPKILHSGKTVVDIASSIAACNFNDGLHSIMQIMQVLQLAIGPECYNFCTKTDAQRVQRAEGRLTDAARQARRDSVAARKHGDYLAANAEGQLYGAGIAD